MAHLPVRTVQEIQPLLEEVFEVEFTFLHVDDLATAIAALDASDQAFLLGWVRRIASTHVQIAYQFARHAIDRLAVMDRHLIEAWALHAMDTYDRAGLAPAVRAIKEVERYAGQSHERTEGVALEDAHGVLLNFLHGLSGRTLKLQQGDTAYTDSETVFLPAVIARMPGAADNFKLAKATVALLWAQTRFGSFRHEVFQVLATYPDPERAYRLFHALETLRLEACLERELPGLHRDMQALKSALAESVPPAWDDFARQLSAPEARATDSLRLVAHAYPDALPTPFCFQGELRPEAVTACMGARMEKEKILLRVKLAELAGELRKPARGDDNAKPATFERKANESAIGAPLELTLDGNPVAPPEDVRRLLSSIELDWDDIPPDFLVAAGPGEYDPHLFERKPEEADDVWQGTYHEEGASFYPEWDYKRQHYRKNWCVMREKDVTPVHDGFREATLAKYSGLVKHLRRTFEAMRDENRLLKRQTDGDNVDIDALIEAIADARDGSEMSDRLFMRMHRAERNIAVMFMVDMSGSTRGWINDAERESLVLLSEVLETLGDRYAIYGFSGMTRKRCELFRIKRFDEPYTEDVRGRISGIRPQDYTRMGFAIRHLTRELNRVDARTRLLITLSDGKPDDYHDNYRTQYGMEDTRKALHEAQRSGIHPFCITLDEEARDYLPHLYGAVNYVVVDKVGKLPLKVADIYRRLTT